MFQKRLPGGSQHTGSEKNKTAMKDSMRRKSYVRMLLSKTLGIKLEENSDGHVYRVMTPSA